MNKPLSLVYNETKEKIIDTMNESKLHPCILLNMLTPIYLELQDLANETSKQEKNQYLQTQESTPQE